MKKLLITFSFLFIINLLMSQTGNVGIGTTSPDPVAALDITSSDKGILIPRTTKIAVQAAVGSGSIPDGLLIFDTDDNSFYYRVVNEWKKLGIQSELIDADGDTKIELDEGLGIPDGINFTLDNTEHIVMRKNADGTFRIDLPNNYGNTAIGENVFTQNETGTENIAIGKEAMRNSESPASNIAIGTGALYQNNGTDNISIGRNNNQSNNNGSQNISIGSAALLNNQDGSGNVVIGYAAGLQEMGSNKLYIENTNADSTGALIYGEFDKDSLRFNAAVNINGNYILPTTGGTESQVMSLNSDGQAVWDSLILMDQDSTNELIQIVGTGQDQIAIVDAGAFHTIELMVSRLRDADGNTKIQVEEDYNEDKIRFDIDGEEKIVMTKNNEGNARIEFPNNQQNIFLGNEAGKSNATGLQNINLGNLTGKINTSGNGNIFLGHAAGELNQQSANTFVGTQAGSGNNGSRNVFIGYQAGVDDLTGSHKLVIENTNADSSEALIYGEFDNDKLRLNAEVNINGDYTLPTDTASANQIMIMGADGKLKWHSDQVGYGPVIANWGHISTSKEIYDGLDTISLAIEYDIQTPMIVDEDGDTKVEVQDIYGTDADKIDMIIDGTLRYTIKDTGLGMSVIEQQNNNENIFIGRDAGKTSTGGKNTFIGYKAGEDVINGEYNTYLGKSAGQYAKGGHNVSVGENSGAYVKGYYNTILGVNAGRSIEGDRNLALGEDAARNAVGDNNVFVGRQAGYFAQSDNKLYIENSSADSTQALIYGEFDNDKLRLNAEVNISGNYTLPSNTAIPNQMMIMGLDSTLQWYTPGPQLVDVNHEYGYISKKEVTAIGLDTIIQSTYYPVSTPMIVDQDGDTKIEVQELNGPDTDKIVFQIDGTEKLVMSNNADGHLMMEFKNNENNTFVGENAGINTVNGDNTMMGVDAGLNNTTGFNNTYLGSRSGYSIQMGQWNTFVGSQAGGSTASGNQNSFFGEVSGSSANGNRNTYLGIGSGRYIQGDKNVALGNEAGLNAKGDMNVFLGSEAGKNSNGGNKLYIENTDADSTAALIYGEFDNDKLRINGDLGIGVNAEYAIHINDNTAKIKLANPSNFGVTFNAYQNFWQARLSNSTNSEVLGVDMTHKTFEPFDNDTLTLGTASYKWKEVFATNATINTSDKRFKKNINDMSYGLEEVMQMRPVTYQWKKEANGRMINGFIAQEMEEIVPEVVHVSEVTPNPNKPGTESEYSELYGMRYTELIPVLTKAIQDQQAIIEALSERVEALEKK